MSDPRIVPSTTTNLVFTVAGIITALTIVYSLSSAQSLVSSSSHQLRRSGAVYRRQQHSEGDQSSSQAIEETARRLDGTYDSTNENNIQSVQSLEDLLPEAPSTLRTPADDNVTEHEIPQDDDALEVTANNRQGQYLRELVFAVTAYNAQKHYQVHHGINCDACQISPIRGVRYKCLNCSDFDLCDNCEASDKHTPTHVFAKIKTPVRSPRDTPLPVWYPGKPWKLPSTLPDKACTLVLEAVKEFKQESSVVRNEEYLKQAYERFRCMANRPLPGDKVGLDYGMDLAAFNQLLPSTRQPSAFAERMFQFYLEPEDDQSKAIGFLDLIITNAIISSPKTAVVQLAHRLFRSMDIDNDGFLSRQDLLIFFCYCQEYVDDLVVAQTESDKRSDFLPNDTISGRSGDLIEQHSSLSRYFVTFDDEGPYFDEYGVHPHDFSDLDHITPSSVATSTWKSNGEILAGLCDNYNEAEDVGRCFERSITVQAHELYFYWAADAEDQPTLWVNLGINYRSGSREVPFYISADKTLDADLYKDPGKADEYAMVRLFVGRLIQLIDHLRKPRSSESERPGRALLEREEESYGAWDEDASAATYLILREGFNKMIDPLFSERQHLDIDAWIGIMRNETDQAPRELRKWLVGWYDIVRP